MHANNPVEKIFRGRIPVTSAMSELFFSKESAVQNLIHELKYRNNKTVGLYLGNLIGESLLNSHRFHDIEVLVPLPLFKRKEKRRGYNQSEILCRGISEVINKPILKKSVIRKIFTETQTKKHRMERWENVENTFHVTDRASLEGKHVLLVDDVITTGATLESCGAEILKLENTTLSIATLAVATK
jgi:ComF family protein